jgi:hypothetical protein
VAVNTPPPYLKVWSSKLDMQPTCPREDFSAIPGKIYNSLQPYTGHGRFFSHRSNS